MLAPLQDHLKPRLVNFLAQLVSVPTFFLGDGWEREGVWVCCFFGVFFCQCHIKKRLEYPDDTLAELLYRSQEGMTMFPYEQKNVVS